MLHEWIEVSFPLVEGIMNWYWLLTLMFIAFFSVLFGLYYEPEGVPTQMGFMDVYVLPVGGTIIPALMAPGAVAVLLLILPVWGTVALACGVAWGIYKVTNNYKEKKQ